MGMEHGRRWGRVLLLLAVLFGVVAMHSAVAPVPQMPGMSTGSSVIAAGPPTVIATDAGVDPMPGPMPGPMPMAHQMLHLCLAVLAALIQLGLALVGLLVLARRPRAPSGRVQRAVIVAPRPPPPTAVRLACLCVLRN